MKEEVKDSLICWKSSVTGFVCRGAVLFEESVASGEVQRMNNTGDPAIVWYVEKVPHCKCRPPMSLVSGGICLLCGSPYERE